MIHIGFHNFESLCKLYYLICYIGYDDWYASRTDNWNAFTQ